MRTRQTERQALQSAISEAVEATNGLDGGTKTALPLVVVPTDQARFPFRVSKRQVDGTQKGKTGVMKQDEKFDRIVTGGRDTEPSNKRRRITQAVASRTSKTADTLPSFAPFSTPNPNPPKLLLIRNVTILNNTPRKISTTAPISVDATQMLDPNYKIQIKRGSDNPSGLTPGFSPYPYRRSPTPQACEVVHRILSQLHGEIKQPAVVPPASLTVAGCGEVPLVLDAAMRTLISGNTMMKLANKAVENVVARYGTRDGSVDWDKVRLGGHEELLGCVKVAGSGPTKARNMKRILESVHEENAKMGMGNVGLSLEHLRGLNKDEAMARLVAYPGIGIKTAACVTLFCLKIPCFAVDTHVWRLCRWLGWVPEKADADNCFRHGDVMVPDHLKYGLHQLFIRHGQLCYRCRKATRPGTTEWREAPVCPLEGLLDRGKDGNVDGGNGDGDVDEEDVVEDNE